MSQQITQENFQVIIRVRPLNSKEQQEIQSYEYAQSKKFKASSSNKTTIKLSPQAYAFYTKFYNVTNLSEIMKVENHEAIYVIDTEYKNTERKMKPYFFSHVYNQKQTSDQIFEESIFDQMQCIFDGYNYTILAYGITGSGKTHTVFGSHEKNQKGISGLTLNYLLKKKKEIQKDGKMKVNLGFSFVEIYNQNVRDLLNSQGKILNIIEDAKGNTSFTDAIEIQIHNQDQIHDLINIGLTKRSSGATMANQYSSRSHAIIQMNVEIVSQSGRVTSKMFIIDLAGSQKIQTLNTAKKMLEGANINKSLLALGNCINILADNSKKCMNGSALHIPYRDSKLTRILKDSLGGNAKTLMIACVSENPFTIEETITTLNYAQRAQGIKKEIKKNRLTADQNQRRLCYRCSKQINGQNSINLHQKIKLPESLIQIKIGDSKQELFETFFQQIYQDIIQNIKENASIQQVLISQNTNKASLQDVEQLKSVNQSQRLQLKETMRRLFKQKNQDYLQKISELNQFVEKFNSHQERLNKNKMQSQVQILRKDAENQCKYDDFQRIRTSPLKKRNSSLKFENRQNISFARKPLEEKQLNLQEVVLKPQKSLQSFLNENQKPVSDENSHVRFSFASLLNCELIKTQTQPETSVDQSGQKHSKRKRSRSKFEIVKRMSGSKLDSNSKELGEVSV